MMDEILQKFLDKKPIAVIVGATIARTIGDSVLDDIFERHADGQYTRELTFSALSRLMTQVVFCTYPSVNAAYQANQGDPRLHHLRLQQAQRPGDRRLASLGRRDGRRDERDPHGPPPPPRRAGQGPAAAHPRRQLPGRHRPPPRLPAGLWRRSTARHAPVLRDGRTGLLTDIVPCEDAYTNERPLYTAVLPLIEALRLVAGRPQLLHRRLHERDPGPRRLLPDPSPRRHEAAPAGARVSAPPPPRRDDQRAAGPRRDVGVPVHHHPAEAAAPRRHDRDPAADQRAPGTVGATAGVGALSTMRWRIEMPHPDYPSSGSLYHLGSRAA